MIGDEAAVKATSYRVITTIFDEHIYSMSNRSILIIYTGGTIGSFEDHVTKSLRPVDFTQLEQYIPELNKLNARVAVKAFAQPKDSSDMRPENWVEIVEMIEENYHLYDGFVVLHGTDTMPYTASAVSFMIQNLTKPIIFTGSQLPIGVIRTDGKENLITAIEIASSYKDGKAIVPEVTIYFEYKLYRANRTFKFSANHFMAYMSANHPVLAEAGVEIQYHEHVILKPKNSETKFYTNLQPNVAILPIFPGITKELVENILQSDSVQAIVLQTYGSGNAPFLPWLTELLKEAIDKGKIIVNTTQCRQGSVEQERYETGKQLSNIGVVSGKDMTFEAAVTKLMFLLGQHLTMDQITYLFTHSISGEIN